MSAAGSCVSATGWVTGSCVSVTLYSVAEASGSCVATPMVEIGKDPGVWEVEDVRRISRMGGVSRVVIIKGDLIEALVRFLSKGGGKGAVFFRFCGDFF